MRARKLYATCRDAGINLFDCADIYSQGRAEEILGKLIAHERDQIVLTSKFSLPAGPTPKDANAAARAAITWCAPARPA